MADLGGGVQRVESGDDPAERGDGVEGDGVLGQVGREDGEHL